MLKANLQSFVKLPSTISNSLSGGETANPDPIEELSMRRGTMAPIYSCRREPRFASLSLGNEMSSLSFKVESWQLTARTVGYNQLRGLVVRLG